MDSKEKRDEMIEKLKSALKNPLDIGKNYEKSRKEYEFLKEKATKEYENLEKTIKGRVISVTQNTMIETKELKRSFAEMMHTPIGSTVQRRIVNYPVCLSTILIEDEGVEKKIFFNSQTSLRKNDIITAYIYAFREEEKTLGSNKLKVCLERELKNKEEAYKIEYDSRIETAPVKKPYKPKEEKRW